MFLLISRNRFRLQEKKCLFSASEKKNFRLHKKKKFSANKIALQPEGFENSHKETFHRQREATQPTKRRFHPTQLGQLVPNQMKQQRQVSDHVGGWRMGSTSRSTDFDGCLRWLSRVELQRNISKIFCCLESFGSKCLKLLRANLDEIKLKN